MGIVGDKLVVVDLCWYLATLVAWLVRGVCRLLIVTLLRPLIVTTVPAEPLLSGWSLSSETVLGGQLQGSWFLRQPAHRGLVSSHFLRRTRQVRHPARVLE